LSACPALSRDFFYNHILGFFQQVLINLFALKYHIKSLTFQGRSFKQLAGLLVVYLGKASYSLAQNIQTLSLSEVGSAWDYAYLSDQKKSKESN